MHDDRPGPAVVDEIFIILGEHPRVGRYGDRADLDGAEKTVDELGRVRQDHQHAVFNLDAEIFEGVAGTVNFFENLLVSNLSILAVDGDFAAATLLDVLIHEGRGGVVDIGQIEVHECRRMVEEGGPKIENRNPLSTIFYPRL